MEQRTSLLPVALRWLACAAAAGLLVRALVEADLAHVGALVAAAGPVVMVVLLPFLAAMAVDTVAWRGLFETLGRPVRFGSLFAVRLSAEAVNLSVPAGAVFAESLKALLLKRRCDIPVNESVAGLAAKKWLTMRAHAIYIALSVALGFGVLSACSVPLLGAPGLPWIVLASALVPLGLSVAMASVLARGGTASRLHTLLRRLPLLAAWGDRAREGFSSVDSQLATLAGAPRGRTAVSTLLFLVVWLIEAVETLLILRVLGVQIDFATVLSFEAGLSLVRSMAFFSPGGLGVQDLGYIAVFRALGLPDAAAVGAAFVILKRAKELVWIAVGYLLLLAARRAPARATVTP